MTLHLNRSIPQNQYLTFSQAKSLAEDNHCSQLQCCVPYSPSRIATNGSSMWPSGSTGLPQLRPFADFVAIIIHCIMSVGSCVHVLIFGTWTYMLLVTINSGNSLSLVHVCAVIWELLPVTEGFYLSQ